MRHTRRASIANQVIIRGHFFVMVVVAVAPLGSIHVLALLLSVVMAVAVGVIVKQSQAKDVGQQPKAADNADQFRVLYLLGFHQALNCLEEDRQAEGHQKHTIHQGTEGFRALPLYPKAPR